MPYIRKYSFTLTVLSALLLTAFMSFRAHSQPEEANPYAPEMVLQFGHVGWIKKLVVSNDGRQLLSIGRDYTVKVWDIPSGLLLHTMPEGSGESFKTAFFQAEGQPVVIGLTRKDLRIRDIASGEMIQSWPVNLDRYDAEWADVALSGDSEIIALNGLPVTLYSKKKGTKIASLKVGAEYGGCQAMSPDGLLLAHPRNPHQEKWGTDVWDTKKQLKLYEVPGDVSTCPVFTADGQFLVTAGRDGSVRFWDAKTGQLRRTFDISPYKAPDFGVINACSKPCIKALAISKDGRWLATGTDEATVTIRDTTTGQVFQQVKDKGSIWNIAFGPDSNWLAYGGTNYDIKILNIQSGQQRNLASNPTLVRGIACSIPANSCAFATRSNRARLWSVTTGRETLLSGHKSQVNAVKFSTDGRWVITGSGDKTVKIWNSRSGTLLHTLTGPKRAITSVAVSPDKQQIAAGSVGGALWVWDLTLNKKSPRLFKRNGYNPRSKEFVSSVHFHPNRQDLIATYHARVSVFNIDTGNEKHQFRNHGTEAAVLSNDGNWLATVGVVNVEIWKVEDWSLAGVLALGTNGLLKSVAISPDNRWIAAGSTDTSVGLWDTSTWKKTTLRGHKGFVKSVEFAPSQKRLLSGSGDGTIRIWDLNSKQLMSVIASPKDGEQSVIVSPSGFFDGNADSMQLMTWRMPDTLDALPLDMFFTDFFYPGLFIDLMEGENPTPPVEFSTVAQVPGLRSLLEQKQAHMEIRNGRPVVCFTEPPQVAANIPVTEQTLRPRVTKGFRIDPNDRTCPYQKELITTGTNAAEVVERLNNWKRDVISTPWDDKKSTYTATSTLHVLVVGVSNYPLNSGFDRLPYAASSANAIESFFKKQRKSRSPYAAVRVWNGLYDKQATRDAIRKRLTDMANTIKDNDVVLLYFAGHGIVPPGQKMFYFVPINGQSEDLSHTGVSTAMLADGIRNLDARRVALFIDSCQSGGAVEPLSQIAAVKAKVEIRRAKAEPRPRGREYGVGVHVIAATLPLSYAVQITQTQSAMAATLLDALQLGQETTIKQVSSYLDQHLPDASARVTAGFRQVPLTDSIGFDFPIAWR